MTRIYDKATIHQMIYAVAFGYHYHPDGVVWCGCVDASAGVVI